MGSHIVYHFEVQVFGVPTYNFSNRYSNLLTVHKNMWNACCFDGLATALRAFPEKSGMFQNHGVSIFTRQPSELLSPVLS